jgi:hypothetical protein
VRVTQQTRYPWDGAVKIAVAPDQAAPMTIRVRIPGWARNEPIPSDLYHFAAESREQPTLKVNGATVPIVLDKGYAAITRTFAAGDTIELNLPMPVRRVVANQQIAADRGRVALQRGPIVFAAEWADNPGGRVRNLMLPDREPLRAEFRPALLKGVEVVQARAVALSRDEKGNLIRTPEEVTFIPYYAWANRGAGQMMVWIPDSESTARPAPPPSVTTGATVTTSGANNPNPVKAEDDPSSSADPALHFDWWTEDLAARTGWIEYAFAEPVTVSEAALYWFDDTGHGAVRVPASWRILYRDGTAWKPVESTGGYGVEKDRYNKIAFRQVTTTALRVEVTMQPSYYSAGIQRWRVK